MGGVPRVDIFLQKRKVRATQKKEVVLRNVLRLIFYRIFAFVVLAGGILGFLTMDPPAISQEVADIAHFYIVRTGVLSGGAALLFDLWIWARP